jgi:hypothetical protein
MEFVVYFVLKYFSKQLFTHGSVAGAGIALTLAFAPLFKIYSSIFIMWLRSSAAWRKENLRYQQIHCYQPTRHTISRFEACASLVICSFNAVEFSESLLVFIGYNLVD